MRFAYRWAGAGLLATSLLGCAQSPTQPDAASAAPGASAAQSEAAATTPAPADSATTAALAESRVSAFVNEARRDDVAGFTHDLDGGANINAFDTLDQTPLIAAVSGQHFDMVKLVVERGANVNLAEHSGWTPLIFAAFFGADEKTIGFLLDHGATINAQNDRGVTPLYMASATGHAAAVRQLLARGADPAIASKSGYTPLRIAKTRGFEAIASILKPVSPALPAEEANRK